MRIEHDIKLDYQDVLFKPKRSTLTSRKDVDLHRTFKFYNSRKEWTGTPVMASNMDGVGFTSAQSTNLLTISSCTEGLFQAVDLYVTLLRYVQKKFKVASGTGAGEFSLGADEYMKKVEEAKAALKEEESNFGDVEPGVTMDDLASKNPGLSDDYRLLEKYLDEFLIFKGENFFSGNSNSTSGSNYVRWDFLVELLNEKVIDQVGDSANSEKPEGIARITVRGYPDNKPLLYTKYKFKNVKNQTFKVTSDELGATVDAELDKIIDMCIDPNIALLPHQINKVSSAELIEFEDNDKNKREIGRIYLSLDFLNKTYRQMRYNDEG